MTIPRPLKEVMSLLMWILGYYTTGLISLKFDDPVSQVAIVWFPAGVAVSAFLSSRRSRWPLLCVVLLATRVLLDFEWRHDPVSTLVHSYLSLSAAVSIAWVVRRFARPSDDLHAIVLWIVATVVICAADAALTGCWLTLTRDEPLHHLFWVTWIANITGVIFATITIMSMLNVDIPPQGRGVLANVIGVVTFFLLCLSIWFIFGLDLAWLKSGITENIGAAMNFALACFSIIFAVIISMVWGGRGATLVLLTLGCLVIHYTDNGQGPFFLKDLHQGEPLLLAQCYLCATALLLVFVRVLSKSARRYDLDTGRASGEGVMYRLHPLTGEIRWDNNLRDLLGIETIVLSTVDDVLERVHPKDREKLRQHWSTRQRMKGGASLTFRITVHSIKTLVICDYTPGFVADFGGDVIVGNWQVSHFQ